MHHEAPALNEGSALTAESVAGMSGAVDPRASRYRSIEKMRRASEAEGWRLDYCQIEPGDLAARVSIRNIGAVSVMWKRVSLRVEVSGRSPSDHMTLIAPVPGNSIWVNGRSINEDQALLLGPDTRLHLVAGPAASIQVRLPCALLLQQGICDLSGSMTPGQSISIFIDMRTDRTRSLRRFLYDTIFRGRDRDGCRQLEQRFAEQTADIIYDAINRREKSDQIANRESWRTINRACEFIWANQHNPIKLADICEHAIASVSKLERTFRREFDVSAGNYVRARRLSAIYRALCGAVAPNNQVSALAMDHGFRHLGRFAADYRRHFGELPSETLRARRVS